MRRKRRRPKSWLARLFSFKARVPGESDAEMEQELAPQTPAQGKTPRKRLDPAEVLALAKALGPAKQLPSAKAPEPASSPEPEKRAAPAKNAPAKDGAPTKAAASTQNAAPAKDAAPTNSAAPAKDVAPSKSAASTQNAAPGKDAAPTKTAAPAKSAAPGKVPPHASSSADASAPSPATDPTQTPASSRDESSGESGDAPGSEPSRVPEWLRNYWHKIGGGSLVASLLFHLGLLIIASFIVTSVVSEAGVDFLSGGGSKSGEAASEQLANQVKTKKRTALYKAPPMRKVVANTTASIALPDLPMEDLPLPDMSRFGGMMGSGGFGSTGAGGGFGNGVGSGGMSGRAFKPIVIFGKNLNARSIAVILDVSGSMTPHLSKVIEELDRVARGSPVILYVGCGVAKPPSGMRLNDDTMDTRRGGFRAFWQDHHGPEEEVYAIMSRRPSTYYIKAQGIQYAWISLLTDQVRNAEALYWFSDFQDETDDEQMQSVLENLKRRKQKLFIHASDMGNYFEKVRDQLCIPSGGSVIQSNR